MSAFDVASDPAIALVADALLPDRPEPLGTYAVDGGVRFAVFSERASRIELCLYDGTGARELRRLPMHGPEDGVFHGFLAGARPGLIYAYRAYAPDAPGIGDRFDPTLPLLDPYAREIVGGETWRAGDPATALRARVVATPSPASRPAMQPRRRVADLVLYELHVKGFTMRLPGLPDALRGTYAGLAHPVAVAHLKRLGVNALSLLPVHQALDEPALTARGLTNYWGYNTIGFFCPDPRFAADRSPGGAFAEFRAMVSALQAEGFEVILDVVFNHTAEGDARGPTVSFRGLDNASWYRLREDGVEENFSGCGNTLDLRHPRVAQFALDALRYWVETMGVDGFRFDLAPALGRMDDGFDPAAPFWTALRQDPTLSRAHLIAEPWDAGANGYQLGRMPGRFLEWNDRFRDAVRGYWLGDDADIAVDRSEFARRFTGSDDLFHRNGRAPTAGVNYVVAHDGRTLADVVAYRRKHNLANGEDDRDGHPREVCSHFGVEGDADDPAVRDARRRVRRAMLATTLLAQGTPMLCAGDEFGNTQAGNNNAYCQDNDIGWLDWRDAGRDDDIDFVARLIALRRDEPLLRHPRWFAASSKPGEPSIRWLRPGGEPMDIDDWHDPRERAFACLFVDAIDAAPRCCVAFNPSAEPASFRLPGGPWLPAVDSSGTLGDDPAPLPAADPILVPARALRLLRRVPHSQESVR